MSTNIVQSLIENFVPNDDASETITINDDKIDIIQDKIENLSNFDATFNALITTNEDDLRKNKNNTEISIWMPERTEVPISNGSTEEFIETIKFIDIQTETAQLTPIICKDTTNDQENSETILELANSEIFLNEYAAKYQYFTQTSIIKLILLYTYI